MQTISKPLEDEGIFISRRGAAKSIICYLATGSIAQCPGSGRRTKITEVVKRVVEEQMKVDDKTTTTQLHVLLVYLGYSLSCTQFFTVDQLLNGPFVAAHTVN